MTDFFFCQFQLWRLNVNFVKFDPEVNFVSFFVKFDPGCQKRQKRQVFLSRTFPVMSDVPRSVKPSTHLPLGSCQVLVVQGPVVHWRSTRTSLPLRSPAVPFFPSVPSRASSSVFYWVASFSAELPEVLSLAARCVAFSSGRNTSIRFKATDFDLL